MIKGVKMKKDVTQKQTIIKFENGHLYTASDSCNRDAINN